MKKKPVLYYIFGSILLVSSVIIGAIFLWLPSLVNENKNVLGWISLFVVIFAILLFIFSIYLLKKGNFLKLNRDTLKSKAQMQDELIKLKEKEKLERMVLKEKEDNILKEK